MTSIIKPGYNEKRTILADNLPLDTPYSIIINPSSLCNFKCSYCIHSMRKERLDSLNFKKTNLSWDNFCELSNQISEFPKKIKAIHIHGWGEPLLNNKVYTMIKYLKKKELSEKVNIITNGILLNESNSLELIKSGVDTIKISLQGITSEKYFETCGVHVNFESFIRNIGFLYENKKDCEIYVKIADIALDTNGKELFFDIFKNISDRMYVETIRPVIKDINYQQLESLEEDVNMYGDKIFNSLLVCPQPFFMLHITSSGDVLPCCNYIDPTKFGNIKDISLKKIWNSEERRIFLRMLLSKMKDKQNDYVACNGCNIPNLNIRSEDYLDNKSENLMEFYK